MRAAGAVAPGEVERDVGGALHKMVPVRLLHADAFARV